MRKCRFLLLLCFYMTVRGISHGQSFVLFTDEVKQDYPSVVYDFLERYLYEIDSLSRKGEPILQRMRDDKLIVTDGDISMAKSITPQTPFTISTSNDRYYQVEWLDTTGAVVLGLAFPMQYELLLGKPKVQIEKEFKEHLKTFNTYVPISPDAETLRQDSDGVWKTDPVSFYYLGSLNTECYFQKIDSLHFRPFFDSSDLWKSAANLFQGMIDSIDAYQLYVEQNLYGYQKEQYRVSLRNWLAYCQAMKLDVYLAIEEEREDGLKALLIAHSTDLGFNHMMSLVLSDNFVTKPNATIKATLNAYIPTQNVKDLYQQYVAKPKKKNIQSIVNSK